MQNIEITATCTLIFDLPELDADGHQKQAEYQAMITATVYPATISENGESGQAQQIEIDHVWFKDAPILWALFPPGITTKNYDRCLMAVQNEIDRQLNAGTIGTK